MSVEVDISPKRDGGVLKQIIQEGVGDVVPPPGSKVKVHYTGTLLDGTKFDSSRDRNDPFQFNLGKGSVIKAWDIGVATMKIGERAILTCSPSYAYGEAGSPPTIPPNATLKFDVEVLDWKGEDLSPNKDGGIEKAEILKEGHGYSTPNDGALVEVHLTGKYGGAVFEDRDISFAIGEGAEVKVIEGVEKALEKFNSGETSRLIIQPKYAFGKEGNTELNVPPNAVVEYIVTLKKFEKSKESWELDVEEKVEQCKMFKEKGTDYFKNAKYNLAIKFYKKIQNFLESEKDSRDEINRQIKSLLLASHLNVALCQLKLNDNFEAKMAATKALEFDPVNEKALFRRGQALLALGDADLASCDFAHCLKIDPNNSAAKSQHAACARILKQQLQKEKQIYANMFDKFAKHDTQREEIEKGRELNVMSSVGEWGIEDREREPSEFEKENPNILMLNSSGEFKDM
ncbi:FK506-binding protein 59-like [Cylas formicarius]|uniref:FK506-binding protein 59-like n=1 Tax=Cylas formicarius TaxID=197179 RepID=UPI00295857B0|nr:FK506-binding protein 59-like [Cylas formicarius]